MGGIGDMGMKYHMGLYELIILHTLRKLPTRNALVAWQASTTHNNVILNKDVWSDARWTKIGATVYGPFANVWVAEQYFVSPINRDKRTS